MFQHRGYNVFQILTILLFLVVFAFQIRSAFNVYQDYDSSYNASLAKNVANSFKYITTYHSEKLFNPEITTGPTLILPAALLIKIFGNQHWVPSITIISVITSLLLGIFFSIKKMLYNPTDVWKYSFTILLLIIFLGSIPVTNAPWHYLKWWYQFVGEVPASLLFVLSISILFGKTWSKKSFSLAGLLLGLSILTKTIIAIAIISLIIFIIILFFHYTKVRFVTKLTLLFILITCSLVPPAIFSTAKRMIVTDKTSWNQLQSDQSNFFQNGGSGIGEFQRSKNKIQLIRNNFTKNSTKLVKMYFKHTSVMFIFTLLLVFLFFITLPNIRNKTSRKYDITLSGFVLIIAFSTHLLWFLFFSSKGWDRHFMPSLIYLIFGIGFLIPSIVGKTGHIIATILTLTLCLPYFSSISKIFSFNISTQVHLQALLNTGEFISNLPKINTLLVGLGWDANRRLEYVLKESGNFKDYSRLSQNEKSQNRIIWVREYEITNYGQYDILIDNCSAITLFEELNFSVLSCN